MKRNVAHQHEIVVATCLGKGSVENVSRGFAIAAVNLLVRGHNPFRRVEQTLSARVVTSKRNQSTYGGLSILPRGARQMRRRRTRSFGRQRGIQLLDDGVHNGRSVRPVPRLEPGSGGV